MKHFSVTFRPDDKQISIHAGATLLEAAGLAGIILNTVCGGKGTCGKCAVNLEPEGKRVLACQYQIQSDLTVTIPAGSRFFEQKILTAGLEAAKAFRPDIWQKYAKTESGAKIYGVAVDIGTTTVVANLIDMVQGKCIATEADFNPQSKFGDDVVSRITYADTDEKLAELHRAIVNCVNKLIDRLCQKTSIDTNHIYEVCAVGNTTMNHLFLKLPVAQLGQAPYRAFSLDAHNVSPAELYLQMNPAGNIHTVENIAGFVGSDITAVGLAVDMDSAEEMTLAVDIGTNGELILGTADKLYAASCAAGPAFEGARISCGSRAMEGAIEAVVYNENDIDLDVIGNCEPRSICGSGLIDAMAVLLELGIVDKTGRFVEPDKLSGRLPSAVHKRIIQQDNEPAFVLADCKEAGQRPVVLTQKDIRQIQLAKAAIRAGIQLLQNTLSLQDADIKHILLAGAFGNYIRKQNAVRIGLLPDIPLERIRFVGNAASAGAQMILISNQARELAHRLASKIEYVEIAHKKDFTDVFADSMLFD